MIIPGLSSPSARHEWPSIVVMRPSSRSNFTKAPDVPFHVLSKSVESILRLRAVRKDTVENRSHRRSPGVVGPLLPSHFPLRFFAAWDECRTQHQATASSCFSALAACKAGVV